jgi:hypothetical protein
MTAQERAETLWASTDGECEAGCAECEASIAAIAKCIADAEAEARARAIQEAAILVETRIARPGMGTMEAIADRYAMADAIRALDAQP